MSENPNVRPLGMLCPACQVALVMSERQNIEIDYCPNCRGVWLDRGELDKIIERSLTTVPDASLATSPMQNSYSVDQDHRSHRGGGRHDGGHRRKSWLGELFD